MENNEVLAKKISEYLELTRRIETMEKGLAQKQREYTVQFTNSYDKMKREVCSFLTKIRPTVETVCGIYRAKVGISQGNMVLANRPLAIFEYEPENACELTIKYGNEAIKLLSLIVARNNVEVNLVEFAKRYNTIVDVYRKADELKSKAINRAVGAAVNEVAKFKLARMKVCFSQKEFDELVKQAEQMSKKIKGEVFIGDSLELVKDYKTDVVLPVSYECCDGNVFGNGSKLYVSKLDWNLNKDGFLVLKRRNQNVGLKEIAILTNNVALQFLFKYPSLSKRVLLCDSYSNPEITTFAGSLRDSLPIAFFGGEKEVKNSKDSIKNAFDRLNKTINERIMLLGQSRYESILEYNLHNQDNTQPIILAVLNGYPSKYEDAYDEITSVLENGKKAGVFFLIVENVELDEDTKYYTKKLPEIDKLTKNVITVTEENGTVNLNFGNKKYGWDTRNANYDIKNILSALKTTEKARDDKIVYLENVLEKENFATSKRREDFSKCLSIPIGKEGASVTNFELRADGPTAHMAIIGTTGSGKTAFINTLVLSACNHYSPEELELHMMIMVKGDFTVFKDYNLPHLKTLVAGGENITANDILDFINEEMTRRTVAMNNQDIYVYNKTAKVKMPRCIIVIDEFVELVSESDEAIKQIEKIARVGRSFGISLIVSSPNFPPEMAGIKHLFGNRIEFSSGENAGQLIPEASDKQSLLTGSK
ncbi:MAG: AAA family ATPase, partial [Clostridia bacterium]|nr:AAA family ATPase [Clostridia bacterium]